MSELKYPGEIICNILSGRNIPDVAGRISSLSGHDSSLLYKFIESYNLAPLFYFQLGKYPEISAIPIHVRYKFRIMYLEAVSAYLRRKHELSRISEQLARHNVDAILLKGSHVSEMYYENPATRLMNDIDILIHYRDIINVLEPMKKAAYEPEFPYGIHAGNIRIKHLPDFINTRGDMVNIHWTVHNRFIDPEYRIDIQSFWKNSEIISLYGARHQVMKNEYLILYLSMNIAEDLFRQKLLQLYDISLVIEKNKIDWDALVEISMSCRASKAVFVVLTFLSRYFHADIPGKVLDSLTAGRQLSFSVMTAEKMLFADIWMSEERKPLRGRIARKAAYILHNCLSANLIAYKYDIHMKSYMIVFYRMLRFLNLSFRILCQCFFKV